MFGNSLIFICLLFSLGVSANEYEYDYIFFRNSAMAGNYFYSRAISNGGSEIKNIEGKLPVNDSVFHTPGNSLELTFQNGADGNWQAAVYYQEIRGVDHFRKADALALWMLNSSSGSPEKIQVQLMARDSSLSSPFPVNSGKPNEWTRVLIPFSSFKNIDLNKIENCIAVVFSQPQKIAGNLHTFYLDDIEFLQVTASIKKPEKPVISSAKGYAMHVDITWPVIIDKNVKLVKIYRSENGKDFHPVGIQENFTNRFADFTGKTDQKFDYKISFLNQNYEESELSEPVSAVTKQMTDEELLTMVQEACFRYYWDGAEGYSGLAKEDIPGRHNMVASGASGFGIMALIVGTERGFIPKYEAIARFVKILQFLETAETFHGVYPHFMDGHTGKVEPFFGQRDNGADLVETAFLLEGLLATRQYFTGDTDQEQWIREKITAIWEKVEFDWFRQTPDSKFLSWHWSPDQAWVINHPLIGWNETMVVYLLAIASPTHPVPAGMYYTGWANQERRGIKYRSNWGQTIEGAMYSNGNTYFGIKLDIGVSNGGPLFFTHYSYMGYDPHFITDMWTNYFTNNQNIAKINHSYCVQNPNNYKGYGDDAWGLTASDGPFFYSADEPVKHRDFGKLTPTGAISSFPYTPEESMKALKNYYFNYGKFLWGEYGFKDAFDLTHNWCSPLYMGLNQAPMTVMIENYRTGLIWKLFMSNAEVEYGLKRIKSKITPLKRVN
jgi:hypothetical protein